MSLENYQITNTATILEGMKQLTKHVTDILMVTDEGGKVIGLITDGDIRRGLVAGKSQENPISEIMSKNFMSASENDDRAFLLDMMVARQIRHLPVIGKDGNLKGMHFLSHMSGYQQRPNMAVIMAGGKGVRLRPLTENCPKPMIKVAGRPILERLVLHLVSHGITDICIAINYMGEVIEDFFRDGSDYGCKITYLKEKDALGSGGALSLLVTRPEHPFLVINGDLITDLNVGAMLDFHEKKQSVATIASKQVFSKISYGVIEKQGDYLTSITEKPTIQHEINIGSYVLSPECLDNIPSAENFPITDLFTILRKKGKNVCVYETQEEWIDVGQHDDLKKAMGHESR